jgi:hypothetical protein
MNSWERANIQAAASYLRERMTQGTIDAKTKTVYEGLLEVLEPTRRAVRIQREQSAAAKAAITVQANRERRAAAERRRPADRRTLNLESPTGSERRAGVERRAGRDRRSRS